MHISLIRRASAVLALSCGLAQAGEVTISAASSLTNVFQDIARSYETEYVDARVMLNFGGSGGLLQQIAKGAPVDVFASADQETMDIAAMQNLLAADTRQDFARNTLVLIVPSDSPIRLGQLADLQQSSVERVAMGNPVSVPAGRYSRQALTAANLWDNLQDKVINTQSVRQSLDYVARGEVAAALVYATDARLMKDKVKIAFTVPLEADISYPIAQVRDSANSDEAKRFITYLQSPVGQDILARHGFLKP
ncbi:MAG TPA: molybdate ABC transporter substrate-binding protein [Alcanivorax sp.]|jgi:molybdate transport system substrate-binding protein|nr:molybdate ABC transporter substrate-binding protein [Alcanivorax sp.]|tara:strand:- start:27875 stop:28627 length:753 start_codon:yes stop_codon:yes gene_type:complete